MERSAAERQVRLALDQFLYLPIEDYFAILRGGIVGENIHAPFGRVAVHVEQAEIVRLLLPDRPGPRQGIADIPGVMPQQLPRDAVRPARLGAGPASVLPLRLRRHSIASSLQIIARQT